MLKGKILAQRGIHKREAKSYGEVVDYEAAVGEATSGPAESLAVRETSSLGARAVWSHDADEVAGVGGRVPKLVYGVDRTRTTSGFAMDPARGGQQEGREGEEKKMESDL